MLLRTSLRSIYRLRYISTLKTSQATTIYRTCLGITLRTLQLRYLAAYDARINYTCDFTYNVVVFSWRLAIGPLQIRHWRRYLLMLSRRKHNTNRLILISTKLKQILKKGLLLQSLYPQKAIDVQFYEELLYLQYPLLQD